MRQAVHSAELINLVAKHRANILVHFADPYTYHDGYPYLVTKDGDCVRITEPKPLDILRSEFETAICINDTDERYFTYVNLVAEIRYHICDLQNQYEKYALCGRDEVANWEGLGAWKELHTYMLEIYEESKTWVEEGGDQVSPEICKKVNDVYINQWWKDNQLDNFYKHGSSTDHLNDRLSGWRNTVATEVQAFEGKKNQQRYEVVPIS